MQTSDFIVLHPDDTVVVLTGAVQAGSDPLGVGRPQAAKVDRGHKIARVAMATGDVVRKYGQIIGYATCDIAAGDHVHSHNCTFGSHDTTYVAGSALATARAAIPSSASRSFRGYKRADGRVGTRNMVALCATVNCSATVIRQAAERITRSGMLDAYPNIDGIVAFAHGSGCGMADHGPGWDNLQRVLWGHATHPNVGAAVFVGLGCEVMHLAKMRRMFAGDGSERFYGLTIQDSGGTTATIDRIISRIEMLLPQVNDVRRTECPASALTVALQCGGSDALSGITANPALGKAAGQLVGLGGTVILSETPEI